MTPDFRIIATLERARLDGVDTVMVISSRLHLRRVGRVFRDRFASHGITVLLHGAQLNDLWLLREDDPSGQVKRLLLCTPDAPSPQQFLAFSTLRECQHKGRCHRSGGDTARVKGHAHE